MSGVIEPMRITRLIWDGIVHAAVRESRQLGGPREACGYLDGRKGDLHPTAWMELPNVSQHPGQRFVFDDATWLRHCHWLDEARLRPMVIWHSHPGYGPGPSEHDIRNAVDPNLLHLIISVPIWGMKVMDGLPSGKLWRLDPTARPGLQAVEKPMVVL